MVVDFYPVILKNADQFTHLGLGDFGCPVVPVGNTPDRIAEVIGNDTLEFSRIRAVVYGEAEVELHKLFEYLSYKIILPAVATFKEVIPLDSISTTV